MEHLLAEAEKVYSQHFSNATKFERAIFFSWGCKIGNCKFCHMSIQPKDKLPQETKRSPESIFAEFILAKHLGWDIGFFTGGIGVLEPEELIFMLKTAVEITGEKIWLSLGPQTKEQLQQYLSYIKGVVGSTETINPVLHQKICPSKPLLPYEKMFLVAEKLKLLKAMTFIVGMGETKEDFLLLENFIKKYKIDKIHVYGLIPQKGTIFEHAKIPSAEEQAWWIAKLRITFPTLDIQCGVWEDRLERIPLLLRAGANTISKFKALKYFGTNLAEEIEKEASRGGRQFLGSLTKLPAINWEEEVDKLSLNEFLKKRVKQKLKQYLLKMNSPVDSKV